jgi:protein-disulfide isomerase
MAPKRVEAGRGRNAGVVKKAGQGGPKRGFYLLVGVVAVAGIAALTYETTKSDAAATTSPVDTSLPPVKSEGYVMGSPTAPLEVVEFGDFECPVCSSFATLTEPDVRARLITTGTMRLRYIDFPLQGHRYTWNASRAAACADEQGKFWDFHDALFQTQDQWSGLAGNTKAPEGFFKNLGKNIGLNADQFATCVDEKRTQAKVQAHLLLAQARAVSATPTFFIGAKKRTGSPPYDEFKKLVDEALAEGAKSPVTPLGDTAKGPAAKPKP